MTSSQEISSPELPTHDPIRMRLGTLRRVVAGTEKLARFLSSSSLPLPKSEERETKIQEVIIDIEPEKPKVVRN